MFNKKNMILLISILIILFLILFLGRLIYYRATENKYIGKEIFCCEKHQKEVTSPAFSSGRCKFCFKKIECSVTPVDKLCDACSARTHRCIRCGKRVDNF